MDIYKLTLEAAIERVDEWPVQIGIDVDFDAYQSGLESRCAACVAEWERQWLEALDDAAKRHGIKVQGVPCTYNSPKDPQGGSAAVKVIRRLLWQEAHDGSRWEPCTHHEKEGEEEPAPVRILSHRGGGHVGTHPCYDREALVEYEDGSQQWIDCCWTDNSTGAPYCGGQTKEYKAALAAEN